VAGDDLFKRYLEIGASVLGMTRERAEGIVRDLVASGEVAKAQAAKAVDSLVERGRTGSDELVEIVRREIRQQVTALGLATKDDVARLEAQIAELQASAEAAAAPAAAPAPPPKPRRAPAAATKPAGVTKSATTRKRVGAAPPAGGADPSKG
jgi:polyhydroxyalkanoate synthesis regulator phasin